MKVSKNEKLYKNEFFFENHHPTRYVKTKAMYSVFSKVLNRPNKHHTSNLEQFLQRIKSPLYALLIAQNISRVKCPKMAIFKPP